MTTSLKLTLPCLACLALLAGAAAAQTASPATPSPTPVMAPTAANSASGPTLPPEPQVLHQVSEDDHVRIEELRVRGQTQRITVQPKIPGMPAYEVVPPTPGKPPSQDPKAGQRVWLTLPLSFF